MSWMNFELDTIGFVKYNPFNHLQIKSNPSITCLKIEYPIHPSINFYGWIFDLPIWNYIIFKIIFFWYQIIISEISLSTNGCAAVDGTFALDASLASSNMAQSPASSLVLSLTKACVATPPEPTSSPSLAVPLSTKSQQNLLLLWWRALLLLHRPLLSTPPCSFIWSSSTYQKQCHFE